MKTFSTNRLFALLALSSFTITGAFAEPQTKDNPTGLKTGVAVDLLGSFGKSVPEYNRDQLYLREVEFTFLAPIDPTFDGVLSMAAHREIEASDANGDGVTEPGEYSTEMTAELHEAYIGSSTLIPRSRFRAGRFQVGLGRLNKTYHRHDWPFISAPLIHAQVFGEEAYFDNGLEYAVLLPLPVYLDWTFGLTDGSNYGKEENLHFKARSKFAYSRLATYLSLGETGGMEIGANYAQTKSDFEYRLWGADLVAKWREGKFTRVLFQGEYWNKNQKQDFGGGFDQTVSGFYAFGQYSFDETFALGLRFDSLKVKNEAAAFDETVTAIQPIFTIRPSEFSRFNIAYTRQSKLYDVAALTIGDKAESQVELQATFILGTHPAHNF